MIYLDNNATTPVDPEVSDAVFSSLKRDLGNPSSSHAPGLRARDAVERARAQVAELIGCSPEEIIFCSGGTEANNLAILGTALLHGRGHIVTTSIEHPSVSNVCRHLSSTGFGVTRVGVDAEGIVKVDELKEAVRKDTVLISVMHANNETGVLQPVEEIARFARERSVAFHVDAAQSIGKMPFEAKETGMQLLSVVSHKFYGPKGVGALYVAGGTSLAPMLFGAGHERGLRPGTENVAGIVGLGKACQLAKRDMKLRVSHTTMLRDELFASLKQAIPDISVNGHMTLRLPNTLNLRIPGVRSEALVEALKESVAVSAGSACHAGVSRPSPVLAAMGLSDPEAMESLRLSVGKDNTAAEVREAAGLIAAAAANLGKAS